MQNWVSLQYFVVHYCSDLLLMLLVFEEEGNQLLSLLWLIALSKVKKVVVVVDRLMFLVWKKVDLKEV